ncbi:MAG TPA: cell division protein ZipA [Gammaproteobacteria bacterium]|nr:cell division protein ZipA [Gammaproteobacteria bacterium]
MWELRLILILIGAVIVTGVYLWSRQSRNRGAGKAETFQRKSPVLRDSASGSPATDDFSAAGVFPAEKAPHTNAPAHHADDQQLILALHVAARDNDEFAGARVLESLTGVGLKYGRYRIFHRLLKADPQQSVFSVANMVEPGAFDPATLPEQTLPGLTLFLVLPGPQDGVDAYADMLATARHLAERLDGEVLDETRSTLTRQTAHHIRERIIEFQRRVQLRQQD